jgi:tetratricopeptide (TPR) repeat protein
MFLCEKFKKQLLNKKLSFFVGAGIDYNSGIPLVKGEYGIIPTLLEKLPLSQADKKLILNNEQLPFESFFSTVSKYTDIDELLNIFTIGEINTNHIFLAKLAKHQYIQTIVTTNFSQLIEKAFINEGLKEGVDFDVIYTDSDMLNLDYSNGRIKLIKIHGCVSDKGSLIITIEKIANKTSSEPRKNILEHLFRKAKHEVVNILGYSCSDVFDITPMVKEIDVTKEIVFIEHSLLDSLGYNTHTPLSDAKNMFENIKKGIYFKYDTDEYIKEIYDAIYEANDEFKKYEKIGLFGNERCIKQKEFISYVDNWSKKIEQDNTYEKLYHISGELLNNISEKTSALNYYKEVLEKLKKENKVEEISYIYAQLSWIYNSLDDEKAYECSISGLKVLKGIKNNFLKWTHYKNLSVYFRKRSKIDKAEQYLKKMTELNINLSTSYMEVGTFYKQIQKYDEAIKYYKKALKIFEDDGDLKSKGWCLGNIGNVYYHFLEDYINAEKYYKDALYIADNIAHRFNQQAWNGNLGNLYNAMHRYDEAYAKLTKAYKMSIRLKDITGQGIWLNNISEYYYKTNQQTKAIKALKKSISIAKKINSPALESRTQTLEKYISEHKDD